jgi:hypothetical protein
MHLTVRLSFSCLRGCLSLACAAFGLRLWYRSPGQVLVQETAPSLGASSETSANTLLCLYICPVVGSAMSPCASGVDLHALLPSAMAHLSGTQTVLEFQTRGDRSCDGDGCHITFPNPGGVLDFFWYCGKSGNAAAVLHEGSSIAVRGKPNTRVYRGAHANGLGRSASYFLVGSGMMRASCTHPLWTQLLDLGAPTRTSRGQA